MWDWWKFIYYAPVFNLWSVQFFSSVKAMQFQIIHGSFIIPKWYMCLCPLYWFLKLYLFDVVHLRAIRLLEFLLDGKLKGPLKRTAKELLSHDATGPTFLEKVALSFSKELFDIYKNKKDPYFCWQQVSDMWFNIQISITCHIVGSL